MQYLLPYAEYLAILMMLYAALAYALDILLGQTGIVPVCLAAFYGLGAYVAALLSRTYKLDFTVELAAAVIIAIITSLCISVPSLRLHDDYFVLATFAFQIVFVTILNNWSSLTNGPLGMTGIPAPTLLGHYISSSRGIVLLALLVSGVALIVVRRIGGSPFGRVLRAIRSDELFAQALGKNTVWFKVLAFMVAASLAAMVGATYAHYITYISPTSFDVGESVLVLSMVIIGGAGSLYGPAVGAILLVAIPEALRFLSIPSSIAPNLKEILFSLILLFILLKRPQGLVGHRPFGR